jgi:hypothetical protein
LLIFIFFVLAPTASNNEKKSKTRIKSSEIKIAEENKPATLVPFDSSGKKMRSVYMGLPGDPIPAQNLIAKKSKSKDVLTGRSQSNTNVYK